MGLYVHLGHFLKSHSRRRPQATVLHPLSADLCAEKAGRHWLHARQSTGAGMQSVERMTDLLTLGTGLHREQSVEQLNLLPQRLLLLCHGHLQHAFNLARDRRIALLLRLSANRHINKWSSEDANDEQDLRPQHLLLLCHGHLRHAPPLDWHVPHLRSCLPACPADMLYIKSPCLPCTHSACISTDWELPHRPIAALVSS